MSAFPYSGSQSGKTGYKVRIGEAAQAAGMTSKALRFYEEHGLLPAAKRNANGYRDYTSETISRLDFIRRGRAAGLALAQIREILALRDAGRALAPMCATFWPVNWQTSTRRSQNSSR
ncbi:mercuric resistance operon regulatory protein [Arthrobacter sp. Hiyo8]|nr:mercuric resistance operon regulatory protein [Arthrobacter sp. Hiyo8]